ncbi:MFS transporter [Acidiferrimicrobium sp. IK]|uniref:MFS transporter n=1 Tax=Acidiferrimicrobium sp. IK TaxID=2871700 RepID=UPI0021CB7AF9|nr:MFS transporter [Acidiferrimicrobium sp. IK]MCU4185100.1 MFS transporter [Acidiferrimicrobium sp. IK]
MVMPSSPPAPASTRWRRLITLPLRVGPYEGRLSATPFLRLALLHACSSVGDALVTVALAGSVFVSVSLSAARGRTALGLVCTVLPFIVVGPLLGPRIDRMRGGHRAVAALSCLGRAGACLAMAHVITSLLLFPAAFFSLVCSKTYLVAKASLVPGAVSSDDDLVTANSRLAVGSSVVTSIAAVIGAGIYRLLGSGAVLYLDVAVLLAGAVLALGVRPARPRPLGLRVSAGIGRPDPLADPARADHDSSAEAVASRRSLPPGGLLAAALTMASMRAVAGLMIALVIFAFRRDGAPLIWYGLVGVASVGGNLGGAAIAPVLRARVREERLILGCSVAIGVLALGLIEVSVMHRRPAALLLGAGVGVGASVAKLAFDALVQREVPDGRRAHRFAMYETGFQLAWVLAALIPVVIPLSLGAGFAIVAVCTVGGAAEFKWGVARAKRGALPAWWPDSRLHPQDQDREGGRLRPAAGSATPAGPEGETQGPPPAVTEQQSAVAAVAATPAAPTAVGASPAPGWAAIAPATAPGPGPGGSIGAVPVGPAAAAERDAEGTRQMTGPGMTAPVERVPASLAPGADRTDQYPAFGEPRRRWHRRRSR